MKKFLLICSILTSHLSYGAVDSLVTNNSSWKYLLVGSDQGTGWTATGFSDASWGTKTSILGYGDTDTEPFAHNVGYLGDDQNKNISTYFRKSFNVVNPAAYSSLDLSLICDDGAVVYLNGTEIYRQGMPSGTIIFSTLASGDVGVPNERIWTNVNISTAQLMTGNNVISVEIHQRLPTSSDIAMNLLLAANLFPPLPGDSLITNNSSWKYLLVGSDQGTGWTATGFSDAAWGTKTSILGYGDTDTEPFAHRVGYLGDDQNKNISTYFRKSFNVVNPAIYFSLDLSLICDDGAVVYLNGTEIYRQGMPAGTIIFSTLATADIGVPNERIWTNVNISSSQLLVGNNVIAVEIHQRLPTSSDIAMNLLLKGNSSPPTVTVTRGPYLQMVGTNSIVVRWQTSTATDSKVSYGLTTGYGSSVTNATVSTEHEISIPGLTQDTKYFYQIGTTTFNFPSDAQTFFKTGLPAGTTTDFTAWVTGDFGNGSSGQISVRESYLNYANNPTPLARKADIWLWLGDNAYPNGTANEYTSTVFNMYPTIMKNTPFFPAVGNHDYANFGDSPGGPHGFPYPATYEYFSAFTMPNNQLGGVASNTKRYYSYNYGNVHFIVLDSYGVVTNSTAIDAVNNPMYTWLKSDLMANTQKWIVCYFHHAPYSKGTHNSDTQFSMKNMREIYNPLLESYQVDLVLSGHSHVYERSFLIKDHYGVETTFNSTMQVNNTSGNVAPYYVKTLVNGQGTVYAVCGNSGQGGAPPLKTAVGYPHNAMVVSDTLHWGSMILNFKPNEIEAKYLQTNGITNAYTEYDSFKIIKNSCVAGVTVEESVTSGDWHTTSTWGCGTIPTNDSMVKINSAHTVTLNTANTAELKKIYVFGMLRYLSNKQLRLKN